MEPTQNPARKKKVDLGAAFEYARIDPNWLNKYVVHGVISMIPIIGTLVLFGWGRRIFQRVRAGASVDGLPDMDFGGEMGDGVAPLVALLNIFAVIFPLMLFAYFIMFGGAIAAAGITEAAGEDAGGVVVIILSLVMMLFYLAFFVLMFAVQVMMPEILRRGYTGEMTPLLSPGKSFRAIRSNPGAYLMTFLGLFVANFLGSLGVYLCFVGVFVTAPFGHAMAAHILAQWDDIVSDMNLD